MLLFKNANLLNVQNYACQNACLVHQKKTSFVKIFCYRNLCLHIKKNTILAEAIMLFAKYAFCKYQLHFYY